MQGEASTRLGFTDYFRVRNGSGHALREVELTEASSSKE
jgi:hypothetical protein